MPVQMTKSSVQNYVTTLLNLVSFHYCYYCIECSKNKYLGRLFLKFRYLKFLSFLSVNTNMLTKNNFNYVSLTKDLTYVSLTKDLKELTPPENYSYHILALNVWWIFLFEEKIMFRSQDHWPSFMTNWFTIQMRSTIKYAR